MAALPADIAGSVVLLADMPEASGAVVDALIEAFGAATGALAAVPMSGERRGNPVLLGRALFVEVAGLQGDEGARRLLQAQLPDRIVAVQVAASGVTKDIDTPDDLDA